MNGKTNGFIFVYEPNLSSGVIVKDTSKLPYGTHANVISFNGTNVTFVGWDYISSAAQYYTESDIDNVT